MITTGGEGGLVLTNNSKFYKISKEYHDHGHENNPKVSRGNDTKSIFGFNYRMTEIQAAIGKVQIKKLNYIIRDNKKKYLRLKKNLNNYYEIREIPLFSSPAYDCFIFKVTKKNQRKKIVSLLNKMGFGTKNLPDAIKWHCSYFWPHALKKKQQKRSLKTYKILSERIAIPIWQKKTIGNYDELSKKIAKIT